jgi:hypothetical protein
VTFTDVVVGADDSEPAMTVEEFSMDAELAPFMSGEFRIFDMRARAAEGDGFGRRGRDHRLGNAAVLSDRGVEDLAGEADDQRRAGDASTTPAAGAITC